MKRLAVTNLNASTINILNVIRQNASLEYQNSVPKISSAKEIPTVGEVICGNGTLANQFISALVNRIALVVVNSSLFNNPYADLKKGFLEFGESVEDIFIGIANVVEYSAEKAESREFKRTLPDVRSAFHVMNWRVLYPITIQNDDLYRAFTSIDGVEDLISKIVEQVYQAAEYDEFLLFKYLLIKAVAGGKATPISVGDGSNITQDAVAFRGTSNSMIFRSDKYNVANVKTSTPKERQVIFMDSMFNAKFDVEVLSAAFNMEKADFLGRLHLIDSFSSFDNERFSVIRSNSDMIDEVTEDELELMRGVHAILVDSNFFQVYDNMTKFTEKFVASGDYWNYFYHTWKTVSWSPFANIAVFVDSSTTVAVPTSVSGTISTIDVGDEGTTVAIKLTAVSTSDLTNDNILLVQTEALTTAGIAVQPYGTLIVPKDKVSTEISLVAACGDATYTASTIAVDDLSIGQTISFTKN